MKPGRFSVVAVAVAVSLLVTVGIDAASGESLVAAGDIASPPGGGRADVATARIVRDNRPTAVLALGDLQYERGEYQNFLNAYDHSWGQFKRLTRPAVGNHEYMDPAGPAAGYFRYFGRQAGSPSTGYYSFDIGPWHAVALNSNCGTAGAPSCAHGSAQWSWLKRDLASHRHGPGRGQAHSHQFGRRQSDGAGPGRPACRDPQRRRGRAVASKLSVGGCR